MQDNNFTQEETETIFDNFDEVHHEVTINEDGAVIVEFSDSQSILSFVKHDACVCVTFDPQQLQYLDTSIHESFDDVEDGIEWSSKFS